MQNNRIIFTKINTAEIVKTEIGSPDSNQVLVKLEYSCISSGTERANITGDPNVSIYSNGEVVFPRSSGYSASGTVVEIGQNIKDIKVGDRVALSWSNHGEYCIADIENVHKIEYQDVKMQDAAFCHIATFPLAAIRKCRLEIGESAIVMGQGILGLIAIQLLKAAGAYPVIAVDPVESRRELALKNGADYAFNPFSETFVQDVLKLTKGVNVAIEVTGNGKALDSVLDCMAKFGRVALLGCTRNSDFTIDYYRKVHGPGISLIGAHTMARPMKESSSGYWTHHDDAMAVLKLIEGKRLDFSLLEVDTHSPCEAPKVYDRLINDKSFPITQFKWGE